MTIIQQQSPMQTGICLAEWIANDTPYFECIQEQNFSASTTPLLGFSGGPPAANVPVQTHPLAGAAVAAVALLGGTGWGFYMMFSEDEATPIDSELPSAPDTTLHPGSFVEFYDDSALEVCFPEVSKNGEDAATPDGHTFGTCDPNTDSDTVMQDDDSDDPSDAPTEAAPANPKQAAPANPENGPENPAQANPNDDPSSDGPTVAAPAGGGIDEVHGNRDGRTIPSVLPPDDNGANRDGQTVPSSDPHKSHGSHGSHGEPTATGAPHQNSYGGIPQEDICDN